jgi:hypothetical protein
MREFFQGWRRKVGVITLLSACVLTVGWMRSETTYVFFSLNGNRDVFSVSSLGGIVNFMRRTRPAGGSILNWGRGKLTGIVPFKVDPDGRRMQQDHREGYDVEWRWDWAGCHARAGALAGLRIEDCKIPYLYFIIPLMVTSGYLWFWKPRRVPLAASVPNVTAG